MNWFYDIEILPSLFLIVFKTEEGEKRIFQISPFKDERVELVGFLQQLNQNNDVMIGYNNIKFDYPLLHHFLSLYTKNLKGKQFVNKLFSFAQELINTNIKSKLTPLIRQIDTMTINTFDNDARRVSLDTLKFVFRRNNVSQLNKDYLKRDFLTEEEIEEIISYCEDDVDTTIELWNRSKKQRYIRDNLPDKYKHLYNCNDIALGVEQLLMDYCEMTGKDPNETRWDTTKYETIALTDVIYPYLIPLFRGKEPFERFINWLLEQEVNANELDGAFAKLPDHKVEDIKDFLFIEYTKGLIKKLTIIYKDYKLTYGVGGLHSINKPGIWESDEEYVIISSDAASFHPSNISVNKLYQEHLGPEFNELYSNKLTTRLEEKKKPKEEQQIAIIEGYKLQMNTVFGKSLGDYGFLSDKKMGLKITVNNQLMITWLLVLHLENLERIEMIDMNTDGIYYKIHRDDLLEYMKLCRAWEQMTMITLEHTLFKKIVMRDGNNYIALQEDNYIKRKGLFDYNPEFYKDHSFLVIPKALEAYYLNGTSIEDFINQHEDIFDFFGLAKASTGSKLQLQIAEYVPKISEKTGKTLKTFERIIKEKYNQSKILRFYVSKEGYELYKIMPPLEKYKGTMKYEKREQVFEGTKGYLVKSINNLTDTIDDFWTNLNRDYYINGCSRILASISINNKNNDNE